MSVEVSHTEGHSLWEDLHILSPEEAARSLGYTQLTAEQHGVSVDCAMFVINLSKGTYSQSPTPVLGSLLARGKVNIPGVSSLTLRDNLVYGSHHFNAMISRDHSITSRGVNSTASMLNFHIKSQNVDHFQCPRVRQHNGVFQINYAHLPAEAVIDIPGRVYFATPREPANWGMWLVQGIADIQHFKRTGKDATLLSWLPTGFRKQLLDFCQIDMDRVVAQDAWKSYRCEELTLLQYSTNDSLFVNDFQKENLIEIAETCSNTDCPTADKIFVSRRSVHETYRALLNEDELCQALIDIGFVVVEPQHLTFQEQIRLFNNAKLVVGLGGAGMFNVAFCQPGTPVVSIESSAAFVSHHADLFSSLGHPYGVILGAKDLTDPTPIHYRWTVDVPAVLDVLRIYL